MSEANAQRPHRTWPLYLIIVLMLIGTAISVYMSRHHEIELYGGEEYAGQELIGCAEAEGVSCNIVNTSEWSEILGVPLFTWAIPTYLLIAVLAFLAIGGRHKAKPVLVATGVGAVLFSVFLYYVSVVELGYVCLWCMRLYAINAALLVLAASSGITRDDLPDGGMLGQTAGIFAVLALVAVGAQKAYRSTLLGDAPEVAALSEVPDEPAAGEAWTKDPSGATPELAFMVKTEDGNEAEVKIGPGDHWKGNPDAEVAVVEWADFECGYCKRAGFQLRRLYETYKDEVLFVFKHFPMDPNCNPAVNNKRHRYACQAHAASECAAEQGYFWAYHDMLFKNNHQLRAEHLLAYAQKIGLDEEAFVQCMRINRGKEKVIGMGEQGGAVDVHGTPRIFIDGRLYRSGSSAEQMARAIEAALGRTGADAAKSAARLRENRAKIEPIPDDVPSMRTVSFGNLKFQIDTFESAVDASGRAKSGKHEIPGTRMSWFAAKDACESVGKRMCSEQEWIAACQSAAPVDDDGDGAWGDDLIEGNAYPYGDFHERGRCWEDHDRADFRPVYTGEMPGCVTAEGVYDLAGNMEEWVGSTAETAVLIGGAYDTPKDKARCYRRNDTFGPGYASKRTGFRCCKSL